MGLCKSKIEKRKNQGNREIFDNKCRKEKSFRNTKFSGNNELDLGTSELYYLQSTNSCGKRISDESIVHELPSDNSDCTMKAKIFPKKNRATKICKRKSASNVPDVSITSNLKSNIDDNTVEYTKSVTTLERRLTIHNSDIINETPDMTTIDIYEGNSCITNDSHVQKNEDVVDKFPTLSIEEESEIADEQVKVIKGSLQSLPIRPHEFCTLTRSVIESCLMVMGSPAKVKQKGYDNKFVEFSVTHEGSELLLENYSYPLNMQISELYSHEAAEKLPVIRGVGYVCKKGLKPESPNQDDFIIFKSNRLSLFGVFDGHGPSGHDISNIVHCYIPFALLTNIGLLFLNPHRAIKNAFEYASDMLRQICEDQKTIDCSFSGTTATIVIYFSDIDSNKNFRNKLIFAHVGDSRAIIAKKDVTAYGIRAVAMTVDHKPTNEMEMKRIEQSGGEVLRLEGDIPHRVFVKGKPYPGLAMSRAIGDFIGSSVGIISDPEITEISIDENDVFLILSSDGLWEFVSNQEAVDVVVDKGLNNIQDAAEELAQISWKRWINEEENVVDDVTIAILILVDKNFDLN